ncbi:hypothetical protein [Streptomyces sp. MZ04]|uniref:hypothetical protein n=1 Tax=Streptomyces sp. MZ04 TaxID=2559236 RepID=UPI00107E70EA|nr:hypothetical protein [Streptomyces sp. MZ04]TGB13300.1 hypothetical protein E2651_09815 [Streptomyces sp. MZ04]
MSSNDAAPKSRTWGPVISGRGTAPTYATVPATADTGHDWLVLASVCSCDGVAVTVMGRWESGTEEPGGEDEVTAVGPDWKPLAALVARELHDYTGLPVFARCTVAYARCREGDAALTTEAVEFMYALADEIGGAQ